jgi:GT2 family glycosyltransferase
VSDRENSTTTVSSALSSDGDSASGLNPPKDRVGVVLVNYGVEASILGATVRALVESNGTHGSRVREIVVIDNASPKNYAEGRAVVESLARNSAQPMLRWIDSGANRGFAGGVNFGLSVLDPLCTYVFLINPDAVVEPDAIDRCAAALDAMPASCLSVAPKMLLSGHGLDERILDSIGHAVNENGEAANIGLGQPDLGQYDRPMPAFGPCFGAALFRRDAFSRTCVGQLDEDLFLYYEDVDWNWRAQLLGFTSITEPTAVVHHSMSVTMRDEGYDAKFHVTERNLMICALKNFETTRAVRVVARRTLGLLKGFLTGRHYPLAGLKAIGGLVVQIPRTVRKRTVLQGKRVRTDAEITSFAAGEQTFFDAVRYTPTRRAEAKAFAASRLQRNEDRRGVNPAG